MRDDLKKLPLPKVAKAYARRKGLNAMKRQPQDFINVQAALTNQQSKKHGFKNDDQGQKVQHAFNEEIDTLLHHLIEDEDFKDLYTTRKVTFYVKKAEEDDEKITYSIETPGLDGQGGYVNYITLPWDEYPAPDQQEGEVWKRMIALARSRNYPPDSVFVTPWGSYLIQDLKQL